MSQNYKYSFAAMAEAFTIFAKYEPSDGLPHLAVEHDIIYSGPEPAVVSVEDIKRLEELDWDVDEQLECFTKNV